jgi:hypothetical protein
MSVFPLPLILLLLAYIVFVIINIFSHEAKQRGLGETRTRSIQESNWFFLSNVRTAYLKPKQFPSHGNYFYSERCCQPFYEHCIRRHPYSRPTEVIAEPI